MPWPQPWPIWVNSVAAWAGAAITAVAQTAATSVLNRRTITFPIGIRPADPEPPGTFSVKPHPPITCLTMKLLAMIPARSGQSWSSC